jgi:hypothetical protein
VYPASENFPTLTNEFGRSPGSMSAFRASAESDSNGNSVVCVAWMEDPFGNITTLHDEPVMGKFSSGRTKLEVAPESITMVETER